SSRMPVIRKLVREQLQTEPSCELNPDEAVALGAAYYANFLCNGAAPTEAQAAAAQASGSASVMPVPVENMPFRDVNSHGLGVVIWDEDTQGDVNSIIIP